MSECLLAAPASDPDTGDVPVPLRSYRLMLVDDHAFFRDGTARLFAYEDDFEVVCEAASGEEAVDRAREVLPDVILMDIDMPGTAGLAAIRTIARELSAVIIVVLTVHEDDDTLFEAMKAGAQGYLVKSIRAAELLDLLRGLARGEAPLTRGMATRILKEFARPAIETPGARLGDANASPLPRSIPAPALPPGIDPAVVLASLSGREEEVLVLVAARLTNKQIALQLVISEFTVKTHLRNILSKLHLTSRTHAARLLATMAPGHAGTAPRRPGQ